MIDQDFPFLKYSGGGSKLGNVYHTVPQWLSMLLEFGVFVIVGGLRALRVVPALHGAGNSEKGMQNVWLPRAHHQETLSRTVRSLLTWRVGLSPHPRNPIFSADTANWTLFCVWCRQMSAKSLTPLTLYGGWWFSCLSSYQLWLLVWGLPMSGLFKTWLIF